MQDWSIDGDAIRAISPIVLRSYVESQGWKAGETYRESSVVYTGPQSHEIVVPSTKDIADYAEVVSSLAKELARIEERPVFQIFRDLLNGDNDVIRFRTSEAAEDGSVDLGAGVELINHARELVLSAACAAVNPQSLYRTGRNKAANDYLRKVRLAQTEKGSFIVALLSPVVPSLEDKNQLSMWPDIEEEPFERKVTRRLADALAAAKAAIEKVNSGAGFDAFKEAVEWGVSANLCEATARLTEIGDGLDASITWARTRSTPEPRRQFRFSHSDADVLTAAAQAFRDRTPREDETMVGYVVKLIRSEQDEDGTVTIRTFVDEQPSSVRLDLTKEDYEVAVRAHRSKQAVSVSGDLIREGSRWVLKDPRRLSELRSSEDAD